MWWHILLSAWPESTCWKSQHVIGPWLNTAWGQDNFGFAYGHWTTYYAKSETTINHKFLVGDINWYPHFLCFQRFYRTLSLILSCSRSSSSGLTSTEMAGMWGRTEHVEDTCQVTKDMKVWTKYGICLSMKSVSPPNPVVSPKEIAIFGGHSELKKSFCYLVILSKITILMVMLSWWYPFSTWMCCTLQI